MTHEEYVKLVCDGSWPSTPEVPMPETFIDGRGTITNLLFAQTTSIASIMSIRGAVRANHYHKTDWHYTYVASGEVLYFEREIGDIRIPDPKRYQSGQMFFTPPTREHAMLFSMNTVVLTFAKNVRTHDNHESDLVRVQFVTPEIASKYL